MDDEISWARNYLIGSHLSAHQKLPLVGAFGRLLKNLGSVVKGYPAWHPLVSTKFSPSTSWPPNRPGPKCGYNGLDHTVLFAHGFVSCPYQGGDEIIASAQDRYDYGVASIEAEKLDVPFYSAGTECVVVRCDWVKPLNADMTVPSSVAVPLMLETALPVWRWAQMAEGLDSMRPDLFGTPNSEMGSPFVNENTMRQIERIYTDMVQSGMYGPEK